MPRRFLGGFALAIIVVAVIALSLVLLLHVSGPDHALGMVTVCLAVLVIVTSFLPLARLQIPMSVEVRGPSSWIAFDPGPVPRPPEHGQLLRC